MEDELAAYLGLRHALVAPRELRRLLRAMVRARDHGKVSTFRRHRDRVVAAHLRFAVSCARRYQYRGLPLEDLVQLAAAGVTLACESFDPVVAKSFATYAKYQITNAIYRALTNLGRTIRLPRHVLEARSKVRRALARHLGRTGREPTEAELAAATGLSEPSVRRALEANLPPPRSLDAPLFDDDLRATLGEFIADPEALDPEAALLAKERAEAVARAVDALRPRERDAVRSRYGFGGEVPMTFAEIGDDVLGRSHARAQAVVAGALKHVRQTLDQGVRLA